MGQREGSQVFLPPMNADERRSEVLHDRRGFLIGVRIYRSETIGRLPLAQGCA
jgi:hypothetical protein